MHITVKTIQNTSKHSSYDSMKLCFVIIIMKYYWDVFKMVAGPGYMVSILEFIDFI